MPLCAIRGIGRSHQPRGRFAASPIAVIEGCRHAAAWSTTAVVLVRHLALDPGGFWSTWQRAFFGVAIGLSIVLIRLLQPVMPLLTGNPVGRTLLFVQLRHARGSSRRSSS